MRRPAAALAISLTAALLAVVPTSTPAHAAGTVVSSDPARFDRYPGLAREDFEGSKLGPTSLRDCGEDISSATSSTCYDAGVLVPGFVLDTPSSNTNGVGVATEGYLGDLTTTRALSYQYVDSLRLRFSRPVDTVGFELSFDAAGTCGLTVAYADGSAPLERALTCSGSPAWVGIEADRTIASVTLSSNGAEIIDDLAFGVRPPPVVPLPRITVGTPATDRRSGTATLPVSVPGIGTTTVSGPGIRTAGLDSARQRVLRLPVAARGSAARTLKRKGKVVVRVTVTYRPNSGRAVSAVKAVTLRKKKPR